MTNFLNYDTNSIFSSLENFHLQVEHAIELGNSQKEIIYETLPDNIMISGMGGSAIGAEYFKNFIYNAEYLPNTRIEINRFYNLPRYVDNNTLVILSSYSGDTEETISACMDAIRKTNKIVAVTVGGKLEKICKEHNIPIFKLPEGFQPRAALGYSFVFFNYILIKCGLLSKDNQLELIKTLNSLPEFIKKINKKYVVHDFNNPAFKLANQLFDRIPLIYSSELMLPINLRWRGQFQENSKSMAFGNVVPEMNHNEINSFFKPIGAIEKLKIILLRDRSNHPRVKIRFDAMKELLNDMGIDFLEYYGIGDSFLERIIDLTLLGDWTSYYLGILYKQDPNAIPYIQKFKEIMNKAKD